MECSLGLRGSSPGLADPTDLRPVMKLGHHGGEGMTEQSYPAQGHQEGGEEETERGGAGGRGRRGGKKQEEVEEGQQSEEKRRGRGSRRSPGGCSRGRPPGYKCLHSWAAGSSVSSESSHTAAGKTEEEKEKESEETIERAWPANVDTTISSQLECGAGRVISSIRIKSASCREKDYTGAWI